jgi:hypothetical protein
MKQVRLNNLAQLCVRRSGRRPPYRLDRLDVGVEQTFPKNALSDHARRSKNQDPHIDRLAPMRCAACENY